MNHEPYKQNENPSDNVKLSEHNLLANNILPTGKITPLAPNIVNTDMGPVIISNPLDMPSDTGICCCCCCCDTKDVNCHFPGLFLFNCKFIEGQVKVCYHECKFLCYDCCKCKVNDSMKSIECVKFARTGGCLCNTQQSRFCGRCYCYNYPSGNCKTWGYHDGCCCFKCCAE